jgi:hypothetical protein
VPALLEPAFDPLAAHALPAALRPMLRRMQHLLCALELRVVVDPDFGQALVGRQLAHHGAEELALHRRLDALLAQRVHPQGRDREVGSLGEAAHGWPLSGRVVGTERFGRDRRAISAARLRVPARRTC